MQPTRQQHALFQKYPLDREIVLGGETVSSPYHIYNGSIIFAGGRVDARTAADLLRDQRLRPMLDTDGNALAAIWVCGFTEANLGAHHELQISIFATLQANVPVKAHPFAIYRFLIANPNALMICHGLWNNTERVVRYNRDHLALDAHRSTSMIQRTPDRWQFKVNDAENGQALAEGDLSLASRQSAAVLGSMTAHLGFANLLKSMREPFIHVPVVNTRGAHAADNLVAHTYTRADKQIIRRVDASDHMTIHHPAYAPLNFKPDFVQHSEGVRFVYLRPQPL